MVSNGGDIGGEIGDFGVGGGELASIDKLSIPDTVESDLIELDKELCFFLSLELALALFIVEHILTGLV